MDVHTCSRDSIFLPEYLSSLCDTNRRAGGALPPREDWVPKGEIHPV